MRAHIHQNQAGPEAYRFVPHVQGAAPVRRRRLVYDDLRGRGSLYLLDAPSDQSLLYDT